MLVALENWPGSLECIISALENIKGTLTLETGVWEGWEVEAVSAVLLKGNRTIPMNFRGSEILILQSNKFHGCWQKTRGSSAKDKGLYYSWFSRQDEFHKSVSLKLPAGMWSRAQVILHVLRNSELRKSQIFIMSCKQTCPTFAPDAVRLTTISVLDGKETCPPLGRHHLHLPKRFAMQTALRRCETKCRPRLFF